MKLHVSPSDIMTCSPMRRHVSDVIIVVSTDKEQLWIYEKC